MRLAQSSIDAHGSAGGNSIWHKDSRIESQVNGSVSEEGDLSSLYNIPDGDVKKDDPRVRADEFASEFSLDKVAIVS